ncbi:MAG: beta-propeller domain-containing protein, partial [Euryarchaeota archaeon]|nr:beta-propeller domain-containing protein [Euryarchaeota archaeon]
VFVGSMNTTSILTDHSSVLYVSPENIYLTFSDWRWDDQIVSVEGASVTSDDAEVVTKIFRLSMDGDGVAPNGMGEVIGYPLNQFSLDEKDGQLRIATCSGWSDRESMVFVLDPGMRTIGSLGGIAPDETIEAARFAGDTLYLVTFLQTDPLFVIDLSDPTEPSVLGELVVPGFSSYLHPMDDGHLIGIGMENGTLKVSLYDVSDPEYPTEVATVTADTWAWSSAQWDHKAVLFDQRSGLLAIPVYTYDGTTMRYAEEMFVYSVTAGGIHLEERLINGGPGSSPHGVIIENVLYTITTTSVVAWDMYDLEEIGSLTYSQQEGFGYWDDMYVGEASAR